MLDRVSHPRPCVAKGMWIAAANVMVIACAITVEIGKKTWRFAEMYPPEGLEVPFLIVFAAIIPALILGAKLGRVADATTGWRPLYRLAVLALPACGLVVGLAAIFSMMHFVPHACIPTCAGAMLLERTTRKPQLVPVATVE